MENNLQIEITKSWRKTLSMRFDRAWILQVKAPKFTSQWSIDGFIKKNHLWIEKQYNKLEKQREDKKWYLFGEAQESLPWIPAPFLKRKGLQFWWASLSSDEERELLWKISLANKRKIWEFYKSQAKNYIPARCKELALEYGFEYNNLHITSAQSRWGSCSGKKNLNFSYRLIMAPREAIDYVIIHELCHLRQMNHSVKFWKEVSDIMPEYKQHEKHLKDEGWKYRI